MQGNYLQVSLTSHSSENADRLATNATQVAILNAAGFTSSPVFALSTGNNFSTEKIPLDNYFYQFIKRLLDILFSFIIIVFIFPWLIPIIALIIKWDTRGPAFFLQKRNGKNGRLFTCIKFRTMIENTESDTVPAVKNDHRITRVGKFLRHYRLDELPQFFNVLKGEMTIVGPRPHMVNDNLRYEKLIDNYSFRYKVKPGISGLAQVAGCAGEITDLQKMKDRIFFDIHYIQNWSPALDIKIMCRTLYFPAYAKKYSGLAKSWNDFNKLQ